VLCWPCFIPWWYKTHYASHYLSVRMPGNEMIHIQEAHLRLHFNIFKQQHVISTLKLCYETKAFFFLSSNLGNMPNHSLSTLTPLTHIHLGLFCFSAAAELSIKDRGGERSPVFGWNIPLIKLRVCIAQKGKRGYLGQVHPFMPPRAKRQCS